MSVSFPNPDKTGVKPAFFTRERMFYKRFFFMLIYISLQNLIVYAVNLTDNIMLGSYNEKALAGAALVNQIYFLLQMIVGGCGEGMLVLTAQYWGSRDLDKLKRVCAIATQTAFAGTLILMAVSMLFPEQLLSLLTDDPAAITEGVKYLRILSLSYLFLAASHTRIKVMRSVENVRIGMFISLSALFVNVTLNWCMIFGNLGFPEMGIEGAAIATLISRVVEMLIALVYVFAKEKILRLRPKELFRFDRQLTGDFLRAASPAVITSLIWGLAMLVQSAILGHMENATAATAVANNVFSVVTVTVYAASSSSGVVIGHAVGAGNRNALRQYVHTLQVLFLLFGLISGALIFLSRDPVLTLLYPGLSEETRALARQFLTVLSVTVVGTGYQVGVLGGIVKPGGSPKVQMFNDMIFMWGFVLPVSLLGAFVWHLPPVAVFILLKCDQVLKCGTAVIVCNRWRWVKRLVRDKGAAGE